MRNLPSKRELSARRLRELRQQQGLTARQLAEKAGIATSYISTLERERGVRTLPIALKLATGLGISLQKPIGEETGEAAYPAKAAQWISEGIHPLRALRWQHGISAGGLGAKVGLSSAYVAFIEDGRKLCGVDKLFNIAAVLRISADLLARDLIAWQKPGPRRVPDGETPPGFTDRSRAGSLATRRRLAEEYAAWVRPHFEAALAAGPETWRELAELLNRREVPARWGGRWSTDLVWLMGRRLGLALGGSIGKRGAKARRAT